MREIKFRAWDKEQKIMQPFAFISTVRGNEPDTLDDAIDIAEYKYKLLQYTGLKDRHGVEIYEGDIVTFASKFNDFYAIHQSSRKQPQSPYITTDVHFEDGAFTFEWQFGYEGKEVSFEQVEVIGNIYENPELLNV